jgi:hypothetical protein
LRGHVHGLIPSIGETAHRLANENLAACPGVLGIINAHHATNVTEASGYQQRIDDRVSYGITVAVARQGKLVGPVEPSQAQSRGLGKSVSVGGRAHPNPVAIHTQNEGVSTSEVGRRGDFQGTLVTRARLHNEAGANKHVRIVVIVNGFRSPVGLLKSGARKPLRGLDGDDARAIDS